MGGWSGTSKRGWRDWWTGRVGRSTARMLIASEGHLRKVLGQYLLHYNDERPHRSRDLRPPSPRGDPIPRQRGNTIKRQERLGGLLSEYYVEPKPA